MNGMIFERVNTFKYIVVIIYANVDNLDNHREIQQIINIAL